MLRGRFGLPAWVRGGTGRNEDFELPVGTLSDNSCIVKYLHCSEGLGVGTLVMDNAAVGYEKAALIVARLKGGRKQRGEG